MEPSNDVKKAYSWDKFVQWCEENGVSLEYWEDAEFAWATWTAGFDAGVDHRDGV